MCLPYTKKIVGVDFILKGNNFFLFRVIGRFEERSPWFWFFVLHFIRLISCQFWSLYYSKNDVDNDDDDDDDDNGGGHLGELW